MFKIINRANSPFLEKVIERRFQIFSNIVLFTFYFIISSFTPYAADDFYYKINPQSNTINLLEINKIIDFQIWHYFNWGGRVIAHFLVQLFLIPSKIIFDITNAIVQVTLINTLFFYAYNRLAKSKNDYFIILLINNIIFISFYKYSGVSIYLTSTINYTWMHLIVLLYYIPFLKFYLFGYNKFRFCLIMGLIVGCTNEHIFIAQLFFFFVIYFLYLIKKIEVPIYFYRSFIGVFLGGLVLFSSPGNFVRAKTMEFNLSFDSILNYLNYEITWLVLFIKPLWFLFIPLVVVYLFQGKSLRYESQTIFLLITGIISSLAMSFSPSFHNGTNLFFFFTLITFFLSLFDVPRIGNWLLIGITLATFALFYYLLHHHFLINNYDKETKKFITNQKIKGNLELVVNKYPSTTNRLINYYGIENDLNRARNRHIAEYYGLISIKTTDN